MDADILNAKQNVIYPLVIVIFFPWSWTLMKPSCRSVAPGLKNIRIDDLLDTISYVLKKLQFTAHLNMDFF